MEDSGYTGVTARKRGRAFDGLALFWRKSRVEAVDKEEVWWLKQSVHVALAQKLRIGSQTFLAVVTHLKAGCSSQAESVRIVQAHAVLQQIYETQMPTLLMGDLNVHHSGTIVHAGSEGESVPPQSYEVLRQGGFRSAAQEVFGYEMSFTCWGGLEDCEVRGCFDYVLIIGNNLVPRRALSPLPAAAVLDHMERLPNCTYPTDHIPVVYDLLVFPDQAGEHPNAYAGQSEQHYRAIQEALQQNQQMHMQMSNDDNPWGGPNHNQGPWGPPPWQDNDWRQSGNMVGQRSVGQPPSGYNRMTPPSQQVEQESASKSNKIMNKKLQIESRKRNSSPPSSPGNHLLGMLQQQPPPHDMNASRQMNGIPPYPKTPPPNGSNDKYLYRGPNGPSTPPAMGQVQWQSSSPGSQNSREGGAMSGPPPVQWPVQERNCREGGSLEQRLDQLRHALGHDVTMDPRGSTRRTL
eukprot:gnl/MRDRNA2_/MRDRNA2_187118_c0_seq1.p1 gnl/MRDRNA2_/MRDRNA2_187118_c0~~gnl/MRDRNA2_/MRDRNA2_187118_c0_seq1.p1  ORF type:complete len:519 (+),score=91.70 gnl/MRDRNA2_/MRDRNA2_187118_c0_seq1:173-1558(+)